MTGRSVLIEFHRYRGLSRVGGPLGMATTLGFITVTWMPFLLTHWLKARVGKMKNALKKDLVAPRAEMTCWDERPLHRTVPRGRT